jgi:hypothetical protein
VALGGSPGVVGQTGVSAAFVVALEDPEGFDFARTAHTAIGVTAALLMSYVVLPIDPLRLVRDAAGPVLAELAGTLDDVAAALAAHDPEAATAALQRARSTDPLAAQFAGALVAGRETALAALPRRRALEAIETYGAAGAQLDLAVRNVRVIARAARRVLEKGDRVPSEACEALRELAAAVRALEPWLRDHTEVEEIRRRAVAAAARADAALEQTANLFVTTIVVSVRSAAIDVLRGTGLERDEALALVRPGAG